MKYRSIFLIGPMGAGKTSVGQKLAYLLQFQFIDTDHLIEQQQQCSITDIINNFGEQYFRNLEQQTISNLHIESNMVIATGGGSILSKHLREILSQQGTICYLQVSPAQQVLRLRNDQSRPLVPSKYQLEFFTQMLKQRDCLYRGIADMIINTDIDSVDIIVQQLASLIMEYNQNIKVKDKNYADNQ